jgi:chemotaxis protein CheD
MVDTIVIGIGEYAVVQDGTRLTTVGLGSCIGTVIYDSHHHVSGMSHIMLPCIGDKQDRIGKYADAALPAMIDEMGKKGAVKNCLKGKIAGGASLFAFKDDHLQIGQRNTEAVMRVLKEYHVSIVSSDVGGDRGRTITFDPTTFDLHIKMVKKESDEPGVKII